MASNRSRSLEKRFNNLTRVNNRRASREDVLNVFTPNSIVTAPARFAGRRRQLEQMIDALLTQGADLIVYGERGCGKSSLTQMLYNIATGNLELLDYYGLREYLETKGFLAWLLGKERKQFNVIWVDGFGNDLDGVMRSILTKRRDSKYGAGLLSYLHKEADQIEVSAKIGVENLIKGESELKSVYKTDKPANVKEGFEIAMQRYADQQENELIIVIDEFETVKNKGEISQYLKSVKNARFVLVGVAATTLDLIGQHASVARDTHAVELKPMDQGELNEILEIGQYILRDICLFHEPAKYLIAEKSYGSPFWCHFLSKASLQRKIEQAGNWDNFINRGYKENSITEEDINALIHDLPSMAECGIWEEALRQISLGDEITEKVLFEIASNPESILSSTVIAGQVKNNHKIDTEITLQTIIDILGMEASPFEERSRIRDIVSFSFRDPNFKRYILLRDIGN